MDKGYGELFFGESQEYLREINKSLVGLEKNLADYEAINNIFRLMHTLKGMAATMGYKELAELAHHIESIFELFRSRRLNLTPEIMDNIFGSIDAFNQIVDELKEGCPVSVNISEYLARLDRYLLPEEEGEDSRAQDAPVKETMEFSKEFIQDLENRGKELLRVDIDLEPNCVMPNARAVLIINRIKTLGDIIKIYPKEELIEADRFRGMFSVFLATDTLQKDLIGEKLSNILDVMSVEVNVVEASSREKLSGQKKKQTYIKKIRSMRIPVDRLDNIMNLMGELSIAKSRLIQVVHNRENNSLEEAVYMIERLVSSLQDEALKMRLLPIAYILDNFPRIVRDLSRRQGKEIELRIKGSEIELDRSVLDEIGDPLLHLIRNAVDHGIESLEERKAAGKEYKGLITINVTREKGHIILDMSDDGRGIDLKKVVDAAVKKGVIDREEASHMGESQIINLLMIPGFSTREKVTDISGRGVGLDVVYNKLDALGGRLDIESVPGQGTRFILTLPLTLAIIKAMLVEVGGQIYAIPLMNVGETVKVKTEDIATIKGNEVIRLRDEVIPLVRLEREFGLVKTAEEKDCLSVVVAEVRVRSIGLVVDKVVGEQDIVVKPLDGIIKRVKGVAGGTILGDGRVALILDVVNLQQH